VHGLFWYLIIFYLKRTIIYNNVRIFQTKSQSSIRAPNKRQHWPQWIRNW